MERKGNFGFSLSEEKIERLTVEKKLKKRVKEKHTYRYL